MSDMTPDQARRALDDHDAHGTPIRPTDAQQALETIAAEQIEYGVEYLCPEGEWLILKDGEAEHRYSHKSTAGKALYGLRQEIATPLRLSARRVSTPWEVEE
jgi:hypothetical protein